MKPLVIVAIVIGVLASSAARPVDAATSPVTVAIDADAAAPGIQTVKAASLSNVFNAAIVVSNAFDVEAFNFELTYDQTKLSSPTMSTGPDVDRNPDANQALLSSTGRVWACSPPAPVGDDDPSASVGAAYLSCFSTGATAGPKLFAPASVIATVQFTVIASGTSGLALRNVNLFSAGGVEIGSCNPVVVRAATCSTATVAPSTDTDGDGMPNAYEAANSCLNASINDASADADADGRTNLQEYQAGTDPCRADTDGDGCNDGKELTLSPAIDPLNAWDFYSVPVPALFGAPDPTVVHKTDVIVASDAQAVFAYFKNGANAGTTRYEQDLNLNGVKDGFEYDRTVVAAGKSGPPDGIIAASEAQLDFSQFKAGYNCR